MRVGLQRVLRSCAWVLCLGLGLASHAQAPVATDTPATGALAPEIGAPAPRAVPSLWQSVAPHLTRGAASAPALVGARPAPQVPALEPASPASADPAPHLPEAPAISLNFQQIELRALLQVFAEFTGLNFVINDKLSHTVSIRLEALPWPQALEAVLQTQGLVARQQGRVVWVVPEDEWWQREKKRLQAQAALEDMGAVHTRSWRLQYARAVDMAQRLMGLLHNTSAGSAGRWLSPRGAVLAEPRTNQLFVSDVPARLREVQALLAQMDVPVRQVMIEARIVEADTQFGQSLGVRWGVGASRTITVDGQSTRVGQLGAGSVTDGPGAKPGAQLAFAATQAGQALVVPASVAVSLFNASAERFLNLELSALEAEGRGQVVSRPRVITADQTKALIEQGTELPYQTATTTGATTVSSLNFRKANLKLEVTPQITPEGEVVLEVDVNRDSVGQLTPAGYAINTKHVKTQVRVPDGGTVVLGGIYEDSDKHDGAGLPRLARWPLLGWLFGHRQQVQRRTELLVFLTPRVLADASVAEPTGLTGLPGATRDAQAAPHASHAPPVAPAAFPAAFPAVAPAASSAASPAASPAGPTPR